MQSIIGHTKQRQSLAALALQDRLPSSLLFSGAPGVGKHLVARELAAQLLCLAPTSGPAGGCGECRSCILVRAGNHPDLHSLQFGENGASLDDLRTTLEGLSLKAFMGGRKIAIFNDADCMSVVGANTILKSLEEPRPETFYILIAANPSRLPPTLLSRCQRWFFDRLAAAEIRAILKALGEESISDVAADLADGSLDSLGSIRERADLLSDFQSVLDAAFRGDERVIGRAATEWGSDKNTLRERLTFLRVSLRRQLLACAHDPAAACVWAVALQNAIDAEYLATERHVNPTLAILQVLRSCNKAFASTYQETPGCAPTLLERLLF